MENITNQDHDLLVEIKVKLERVITDVADVKTNLVAKVESLEKNKADVKTVSDLLSRTEHLENWKNYVLGIALITGGLSAFLAIAFFNHIAK